MLQLRSSSSQSDSSSSIADNNNESLHSNTSHPSFSPSSSSSSAVHSVSTASLQLNNTSTTATLGNTLGIATTPATTTTTTTATAASPTTVINSSITSSLSSKPSSPAKKPPPFQNLGLHSGAASGNLGLVKFALDNGQPIDSVLNGVYAIHAACCSNANVAVVMFLIERGADVNARRLPRKYSNEKSVQTVGTTGSTPLHFAAANGCLAIVDILLRHGAIVDMTDKVDDEKKKKNYTLHLFIF
ncbi:ankyrin repeat-containing domain protein [Lobosporangium transversale]|uniref:protein S-acyltransferase n=1 Tax=Lobosporangium transversale TaxID=64571 RepID=A0A1Y2GJX6_9FUNG|nr:ankyrin repeat-containing domain protein [Lobosporangium transversale]ORZ13308.1 ankyrin repeat-containing domain protein [Lobosporangium transversale]|eukprot:XP_021880389.1 ankyrin repeat-containing domain protein [Lobosporangium transversale]